MIFLKDMNNMNKYNIPKKDLKFDYFRASGKGGQNVNKTSTAVRVTHLPTNTVVTCQDERSQIQNKKKALESLKTKLLNAIEKEKLEQINNIRKKDMETRIRTYNFKSGQVTDDRVKNKKFILEKILNGELNDMLKEIRKDNYKDNQE